VVTAAWEALPHPSARDWLGLYPGGAHDHDYLAWQYVSCGPQPDLPREIGSCAFAAPVAPGGYELRLFADDTFARLATSNPFAVLTPTPTWTATSTSTPVPPPPSLAAAPGTVLGGETVTASWTSVSSPTAGDWLGL
jgi:hypothetical protein